MDVSQLTLKLIILLIPGAIAYLIYQKLTISYKRKDSFVFIINSILFGAFTYLIGALIFGHLFKWKEFAGFWFQLKSEQIPFNIVGVASVCAVIIGYVAAVMDNNKWVNRTGQHLGFSHKYGDENLFTYLLTREDVQEVTIHDIANNLTYNGFVRHYSECDDFKEVVLKEVNVYAYDAPEKGISYSLKLLYLARPKDNIVIEVPLVKNQSFENGKEATSETKPAGKQIL